MILERLIGIKLKSVMIDRAIVRPRVLVQSFVRGGNLIDFISRGAIVPLVVRKSVLIRVIHLLLLSLDEL